MDNWSYNPYKWSGLVEFVDKNRGELMEMVSRISENTFFGYGFRIVFQGIFEKGIRNLEIFATTIAHKCLREPIPADFQTLFWSEYFLNAKIHLSARRSLGFLLCQCNDLHGKS